jgi:cell wall-associated NlpC family hydrolase
MATKIICVLSLGLALTLSPEISSAVPTRGATKKTSSLKAKQSTQKAESSQASKPSRKAASKKKRTTRYSSKKKYRSVGTYESQSYDDDTPLPQPVRAGVGETKPLMKVTPQRDGRFLLEPLSPKPKVGTLSRPSSSLQEKNDVAPGGRGYNLYEPWNFRELVLSMAKGYQGTRYSYGSSLEYSNATDCSGFVQYIYKGFKINLPRSSAEQAQVGQAVSHTMDFSKLVPGDLLFFSRGGRSVGHAGIYLGEGKMIHASTYRTGVIITDLRQSSYQSRFVVAKRVFEVSYLK